MPIYRYRCPGCSLEQEIFQKMSDPDPACSSCNTTMARLFQPFGVDLRGPGFHKNEYPTADQAVGSKAEAAKQFVVDRKEQQKKIKEETGQELVRTAKGDAYYTTSREKVTDFEKTRSTLMKE